MSKFKKLRIGYVPHSKNLDHPGDRRRFVYYANKRNINFDVVDKKGNYDVIVISGAADHSYWIKHANKDCKYIFDFVNSYLSVDPKEIRGLARGTAKFISRQHKYFRPNYWKTMRDMCACSEAVICTTEEQEKLIKNYSSGVYKILDVQDEVMSEVKKDYSKKEIFNFVWEGFASNTYPFSTLKNVLKEIDSKYPIAIHYVTDLHYFKYLNKFGRRNTVDDVKNFFHRSFVYQHNASIFPKIATACDAAIIPLDLTYPLFKGKPENKLALFWKLGLPAITSGSPAYLRAMKRADIDLACLSESDWYNKIEKLIHDDQYRETTANLVRDFAEREYHTDKSINEWDKIFSNHFT
tara:strand:+ start:325 stop:1380 length:1056 start_codon:yes stop_codon:yes gene_type:complete